MKSAITLFVILFACITAKATTTNFSAPMDTIKKSVMKGAFFEEELEMSEKFSGIEEPSKINYARKVKALPLDFNGYKIEVVRVYHKPLAETDEFLMKTGGVSVERIGENTFAYLIGDFETEKGMLDFLEKVVKPNYSDAKAIYYKKGVRMSEN